MNIKDNIKNFEKFQVRSMNVLPELLAGFVVSPKIVIDDTVRLKQMYAATGEFDYDNFDFEAFIQQIRLEDIFSVVAEAITYVVGFALKVLSDKVLLFLVNAQNSIHYQLNLHRFKEIVKPRLFVQSANSNLFIHKKQFRFNLCHQIH